MADVGKLSRPLSVLLVSKQIPWIIQGEMGRQGYTTVGDLADRWNSPEEARLNGPRDLDFEEGQHGFTARITEFTAMRLLQAVRTARQMTTTPGGHQVAGLQSRGMASMGSTLEATMDRRSLEEAYMKTFAQNRPKLEHQGSDALLKRQCRFVNRGELGFIQVKHIVSALPEEGERPTKTSKRFTLDGFEGTEEEEIRANPTARRQLERMHMVFRTTLLMCIASSPQFSNLAVTKQDLDDWYEWFYGERNAWRKIHDMVHGGMDLKDALASIKGDLLFWTREVYERVHKTTKQPQFKGKGRTKHCPRPLQSPWQPQWTKPNPRKGKGSHSPGTLGI